LFSTTYEESACQTAAICQKPPFTPKLEFET
jgi:hypothetical protein